MVIERERKSERPKSGKENELMTRSLYFKKWRPLPCVLCGVGGTSQYFSSPRSQHTHKLRFRLAFFDRPLKVSHLFLVCFDSAQARRVQRPAAVKSITTTAGFFGCCIARSGIAGDDDDGDDPQNNGTKYLLARGDTSA